MRYWYYNELGTNRPLVVSDKEILAHYWEHWKTLMEKAINRGSPNVTPDMITEENCIRDWVVVHWAWEKL